MKYRTKPIEVEAIQARDVLDAMRRQDVASLPEPWRNLAEYEWHDHDGRIAYGDGAGYCAYPDDWFICRGNTQAGYPCVELVLAADFATLYELALPPGFTPPRADRPPGYQFGLDDRIKLPPGSPTMLETLKEQRR